MKLPSRRMPIGCADMRLEAKTPVWVIPARWTTLSMISAISPRGEVAFQMVEGGIDADRFIAFLAALIQDAPKKIYLVADNLRVHHAKVVTAWLADKKTALNSLFCHPTPRNPIPTNTSIGTSKPLYAQAPSVRTKTPFWQRQQPSCRACAKCRTRSPAIFGTPPLATPCRIFKGRVNNR